MIVKDVPITSIKPMPADEKHQYPQWVVEIMTNNGIMKGYANQGKWNNDWKPGMKVKAGVEIMKSKSTGDQYAKLSCPPELRTNFNRPAVDPAIMGSILAQLVRIADSLEKKTMALDESDEAKSEEKNDDEIDVSDIPF